MASGRMVDYLAAGTFASRPASLSLTTGACGVYYATDTDVTYIWDGSVWNTVGGGGSGTVTSVSITPGTGITQSGSPVTTSGAITVGLANTAVTPGSYTSADITVDAQGRVTAAANGTGGGGNYFSGWSGNGGAPSGSAFATKGHDFIPSTNISVSSIKVWLSGATAGHSHVGRIATVDSAGTIGTVLGSSSAVNAAGGQEILELVFSSPLSLTSGTRYILAVSNTSGTGTEILTVCTGDITNVQISLDAPGNTTRTVHIYSTTGLTAAQAADSTFTSATWAISIQGTF